MGRVSRTLIGAGGMAISLAGYLPTAGLQGAGSRIPLVQAVALEEQSSAASFQGPFVGKYCVACHNEKSKTAGLMLDKLDMEPVGHNPAAWEKVVQRLRARTMPPIGRPRPDDATYEAFVALLETALDGAAAAHPNHGRTPVHRLNRIEYTNAVRDLLALDIDGPSLLPADESGYGFDNAADVLGMTPALLERYMFAAQKISRLAVGDLTMPRADASYRVSPFLDQADRMSDDLPLGSRGGVAVRHYFPLSGEYALKIDLRRNWSSPTIRGLDQREQIEVRLDGTRLKLFDIGGECVNSKAPKCEQSIGSEGLRTSEYERTADSGLEVRFQAKAGPRLVGVAFVKRTAAATESAAPTHPPLQHSAANIKEGDMTVDFVHIKGPFGPTAVGDTPSRRRIFVCRPTESRDEETCATKILATVGRRAYRRPVTDQDIEPLLPLYRNGHRSGGFEAGVRFALEGLLVSPSFLLRIERDPANATPGMPYRISDLELASRLSFFLWSSIPDDELLEIAARGELSDPNVLAQQVRRMLGDYRARSLVTNFCGQWLYLRNLQAMAPDPQVYPDFDDSLREAFQRETELFLESQLREDHGLMDLLTSNYTFLNERLARFYGIPNVYGTHYRRVTVADSNRRGLLGHGSILTVTSYSTRTSPVVRGKWLLENLLGAPPPPPPANVPVLREIGEDGQPPATMRERIEEHRRNPACANCHVRMDPLGFALENFDGIGKWRTSEAHKPIDTAGVLSDGTRFEGPAEFRNALLNRHEQFVRTVTEKLLTYALGRGVEYYDMPDIRVIIRNAAPDYRWSSLILGIGQSKAFQMKNARPAAPESVAQ